ncbi:MAG: hypothetical protein PHW18_12335 [Sulfuricurvum sp.]|uniref:hypothetical protein n=1 Tax=Sulfuricurvum sp. TaxID=2025608 RepID=UPI00260DFBAD|nr:hypothetical protein [Sulfuricurvum sp.]MDD2830354.1 hypothetical protein [Sulfuricurvum sp.]MDD4950683.1 hypothetical protein [Sulfuricurvum sp.]
MDIARLKSNHSHIIDSDNLPFLNEMHELDKDAFICIGCQAKALPCSYKPINKKRAYFMINDHENGCDAYKYEQLLEKVHTKSITTESGFPYPYPTKLYLQDILNKTNDKKEKNIESRSIKYISNYANNTDKIKNTSFHHHTAGTIRPIVKHFISFPYDRNNMLSLPMLDSSLSTYNQIFKKISQYKFDLLQWKKSYTDIKLYYARLSLEKDSIKTNNGLITLKLLFSDYSPVSLIIDTTNWSNKKRNEILDELSSISKQKKDLYIKTLNAKISQYLLQSGGIKEDIPAREMKKLQESSKSIEEIYIFFVGSLDTNNSRKFILFNDDFRLYYASLCNIVYPAS